jgi:hypothetical protein
MKMIERKIRKMIISWSIEHMKKHCYHCCGGGCKDCFAGTLDVKPIIKLLRGGK